MSAEQLLDDRQFFLDCYERSKNDYWLALVALTYIDSTEPMPDYIKEYVRPLLVEVVNSSKGHKKRSAEAQMRHDAYVQDMRLCIFLTDAEPGDAARRILYLIAKHAPMLPKRGNKIPDEGTLMSWWWNRDERFKQPLTADELPYQTYEAAEKAARAFCQPSKEYTRLQVKKELFR